MKLFTRNLKSIIYQTEEHAHIIYISNNVAQEVECFLSMYYVGNMYRYVSFKYIFRIFLKFPNNLLFLLLLLYYRFAMKMEKFSHNFLYFEQFCYIWNIFHSIFSWLQGINKNNLRTLSTYLFVFLKTIQDTSFGFKKYQIWALFITTKLQTPSVQY